MEFDFESIIASSAEEFAKVLISQDILDRDYLRADEADVARIERFLDLDEGTLSGRGPYYLKIGDCRACGQPLRVSDFVLTAMLDASHPRWFVTAILRGDKKIIQQPRKVRCSRCGTVSLDEGQYWMGDDACTRDA